MGGGGGGLLGGVNEVLFGDGGAGAAQNAALAKQGAANRQFGVVEGRINDAQNQMNQSYATASDRINRATVSGLANAEKALQYQDRNLGRQEQLISQLDPTIIEASQQALRLLRGETSTTLNPLKKQREMQRQKLVNSLREQLGPGAETSSAGMQALSRFDSESSNLFAGAQQQALSNLGGVAGQFNSTRPDILREISGFGQLGQNKYNIGLNEANFYSNMGQNRGQFGINAANALQGAGQNVIDTAGAENTAAAIRGQNAASYGRALVGGLTSGLTGGASAALGGAVFGKGAAGTGS